MTAFREEGTMTGQDRYGVLVGIDGSPPSSAALDWAISEAQARHSLLTICHVINARAQWDPYFMWLPREETIRELLERAGRLVDEAAARVALRVPGLPVRTVLGDGRPAAELLRLADGADVLVLGNR